MGTDRWWSARTPARRGATAVRPTSRASRRPVGPRQQMVAIGLAGTVLHLVLVGTAVLALQQVNAAHADVDAITAAQSDFQRADMAHDAMRAEALAVLLAADAGARADSLRSLESEAETFRTFLDQVDAARLPPEIDALLSEVRPEQEDYTDLVIRVGQVAAQDPAAALALQPTLDRESDVLAERQGAVTAAMSREADHLQQVASDAESSVAWRLGGSAVVALLGMLALTVLLHRLGGALAATLARERDVAETLQHRLLPDRLPEVPGVRLAARYVPGAVGTQVGGDWYDVIPLPSGEVGLVMGDVVGHDLDAAADMGQLRNALRACAAEGAPPAEVLQQLNRLCLQQDLGGMATVLYAVLDPVLGTLRMANAGHYPPLLVTTEGSRFLECEACPPVGAVREVHYSTTVHRLPPGSLLLLYTDGLVERRDVTVERGMSRLQQLVAEPVGGEALESMCDAVLSGMLDGDPSDDDVALLAVAAQSLLGRHLDLMLPAEAEQLAVLRRTLERWLVEAGASDEEVYEITVACSEAATNAIEHAYGPGRADVQVVCDVTTDGVVSVSVRDWGQWREARGRDRGRGVGLMHGLMDEADVRHGARGTHVVLRRRLAAPTSGPVPAAPGGAAGRVADGAASGRAVDGPPRAGSAHPADRSTQGVDA